MASIGELLISIGADITALKEGMSKATSLMQKTQNDFESIGKNMKNALVGALTITGVVKFAEALNELAHKGDELNDVSDAFDRLGGTQGALDAATQATQGMVSQLDLMKAANDGLIKGIPDFNKNFGLIADLAARNSEALGVDMKGAITSVTDALQTFVTKGKTAGLAAFGVFVEKGESMVSVMEKVKAATERLAPVGDGGAAAFDRLSVAFDNFQAQMGRGVENSSTLVWALNQISQTLNDASLAFEYWFQTTDRAKYVNAKQELDSIKEKIEALQTPLEHVGTLFTMFFSGNNKDLQKQLEAQQKIIDDFNKNGIKPPKPVVNPAQANAAAAQAEAAAKKIKEAQAAWDKFRDDLKASGTEERLKSAISLGDEKDFRAALEKRTQELNDAYDKVLQEYKDKGIVISDDTAEHYRAIFISKGISPAMDEWDRQAKEVAKKAADEFTKNMSDALEVIGAFATPIFQAMLDGKKLKHEDYGKMTGKAAGKLLDPNNVGYGQFVDMAVQGIFKAFNKGDNAGTKARKELDKFFYGLFEASHLALVINGQLQQVNKLVFQGNNRGEGLFKDLPAAIAGAFVGVGTAFQQLQGIALKTGVNLGNVLANNIGGSLNNLGIMIRAIGYDAEKMGDAIMDAMLQGQLSFSQAQQAINGINLAMQKGIPDGIGKTAQAFDNLKAAGVTGGRVSTDAMRDLADELLEVNKNAKTLDELGANLIKQGKDAGEVKMVLDALKGAGIDSIKKLSEASDKQLLPALAKLQDMKFPFTEGAKSLDGVIKKLESIPKLTEKDLVFNVHTNMDKSTVAAKDGGVFTQAGIQMFAKGGIVSRATMFAHSGGLGVMGEAGAEAILPLTKVGGELGVRSVGGSGNGIIVQVHAPGAAPGMEHHITRAIQSMGQQVYERTISAVADLSRRGAL